MSPARTIRGTSLSFSSSSVLSSARNKPSIFAFSSIVSLSFVIALTTLYADTSASDSIVAASKNSTDSKISREEEIAGKDLEVLRSKAKGTDFERIDEKYLNSREGAWFTPKNLVHDTLRGKGKIEV